MGWSLCQGGNGGSEIYVVQQLQIQDGWCSASSTVPYQGFSPSMPFDGTSCNLSTLADSWLAVESDNAPWLQVHLPRQVSMRYIQIETANNNFPDTYRDIYIEGSNDGVTWDNILNSGNNVSILFEVGDYNNYSILLNGGVYEYIRIRGSQPFFGGANQYACGMSQIKIYEEI